MLMSARQYRETFRRCKPVAYVDGRRTGSGNDGRNAGYVRPPKLR